MNEPNLCDDAGEELCETATDQEPVLLLTAEQLAARMNLSKRTIYRLIDAGRMIQPIRLGGIVRWRAAEVEAWIAAGCPERLAWEALLASNKRF